MSMSDPIADMLTRIRNALAADKVSVSMPSSKQKVAIAELLKAEGYIHDSSVDTVEGKPFKQRLAILEFPSREAIRKWFASPEYQEAKKYRDASSEAQILVIEGTAGEDAPDPKVVKSG